MSARHTHKLGAKPIRFDSRDLLLSNYLDVKAVEAKMEAALEPTKVFGWGHSFQDDVETAEGWRMLGNGPDDSVEPGFEGAGDCVFAGAAHETQVINISRHGKVVHFTGKQVISDYSKVTGYVLGDESTDQGTDPAVAAKYRQKTGILDADGNRHKVKAYAFLDAGDFRQLRAATFEFGIAGIAFAFPDYAWDQFDEADQQKRTWDYEPGPYPQDGHYVGAVGSDDPDEITVASWARRVRMKKAFYENLSFGGIVYFSEEMFRADGKGLHGFDEERFQADLAAL